MLWNLWRFIENKLINKDVKEKECFVILGVPRSGTSLLGRLVNECGVYFGDSKKFKKADWRNPDGFFEHKSAIRLDINMFKQSGIKSPFVYDDKFSLRAQGVINRFRRSISRLRMMMFINRLSSNADKYALKEFPTSFYFWKPYIRKTKIIAIYRDPFSNADSMVRSFRMHTYSQSIKHWTAMNRELIYHISTNKSILINLDDLNDIKKQEKILKQLVDFIGEGDIDKLKNIINSSIKNIHKKTLLSSLYPLDENTNKVWEALEKAKIN